jgi:hypothetical protein
MATKCAKQLLLDISKECCKHLRREMFAKELKNMIFAVLLGCEFWSFRE